MCSEKKTSFKDFDEFYDYYNKIYEEYNKYGDRIIEVEFEKIVNNYEEQIKNALQSNLIREEFNKSLGDIWYNYITILVKSVDDLKKVPVMCNVSIYGKRQRFAVKRSFLNQIIQNRYKYHDKTYAMDDNYIYIIEFDEDSFRISESISIEHQILKG